MVLSSVRKQNISAQLAAQLAPSSKIISVSSICAKYGAETGEDARHSQTVASCRGYSETVHSGRNQGFLSNGCIGCIYLVKILAHCAMLQCMSRYNKPP